MEEIKGKEEISILKKQIQYLFFKVKELEATMKNLEKEIRDHQYNSEKEENITTEEVSSNEKEIKEETGEKEDKRKRKKRKEKIKQDTEQEVKQEVEKKQEKKQNKEERKKEKKEIKKIKKDIHDLMKRVEKIEKILDSQQAYILESELRIQKQKEAIFFTSISNIIKNFIDFKYYIENLTYNPYTKKLNFSSTDSSFLSLFDNITYIFSHINSYIKEKWLSFKIKRSLRKFNQLLDKDFLYDEKYALVYDYLTSTSIKNDTDLLEKINYYFHENDVKLIKLLKKIFTKGITALNQEDINFYTKYVKNNLNNNLEKENEKRKPLLNFENIAKQEKTKIKIRR